MSVPWPRLVVIGASTGGVSALIELARGLPRFFPAPVCIVQHVGAHQSLLPELLRFHGPNPAMHAEHGQRLRTGTLHVAPPDHHMLVEGDRLLLARGPKENHARPAIDPLFRSAALRHGARVIGVVLTGQLDDGTAGLKAVSQCGGTTIVQDPDDAVEPQMPRSALAHVAVDFRVPLAELADLLVRLVGEPAPPPAAGPPRTLMQEDAMSRRSRSMQTLSEIATPSTLTCPECHGSLWEVKEGQPLRFRCHTGHAYSALSLARAQAEAAEESLWSGVRALRERELLLRRFAAIAEAAGDAAQAAAGRAEADRLLAQVGELVGLAESASLLRAPGG